MSKRKSRWSKGDFVRVSAQGTGLILDHDRELGVVISVSGSRASQWYYLVWFGGSHHNQRGYYEEWLDAGVQYV